MHLKHVKEHICLLLIKIFLRYFIYVLFFHKQDICEILIRHFWYLKNIIINLKHITKEIYILYFSIFIYIYIYYNVIKYIQCYLTIYIFGYTSLKLCYIKIKENFFL